MKMQKNKKGLDLGGMYSAVLMLVLIAVLIGIGVLILGKFQSSSGISDNAILSIGNSVSAIGDFSNTWMAIIVVVVAAAVVIGILISAFANMGGRK
jgi:type II secretory pathway component PulF